MQDMECGVWNFEAKVDIPAGVAVLPGLKMQGEKFIQKKIYPGCDLPETVAYKVYKTKQNTMWA